MAENMKEHVRRRYAEAAQSVDAGSCCGDTGGSGCEGAIKNMTGDGYAALSGEELPPLAVGASLGCGNPVALAELSPGEVVLDLGSGGGIDVLLSARRVLPGGKAYGLDMTDEMLELARQNQREDGAENVEFLKGEIEAVPLPENHVDVVMSNCVINLSTEKERVFSEAFRVLRPGGRLAVYDVVFDGDRDALPQEILRTVGQWTGCVSGALERREYEAMLSDSGFGDVSVEITHTHDVPAISGSGVAVASAFVRARKPVE